MPNLQELDHEQIRDVLTAAAAKQIPITVTVRVRDNWNNLRSRILALESGHLLIDPPTGCEDHLAHEFAPADKIHINFKLKHYKHMLTATVAGSGQFNSGGTSVPALSVVCPTTVLRLQRRAFHRVAVPEGRIVRASFWLGGAEAEPAGTSADRPVWSGRVTNLSAGGFQVVAEPGAANALDVGEVVGVRLAFGPGEDTVFSDARFRHVDLVGHDALLGFQLMGLAETPRGREALQRITTKVIAFQKHEHAGAGR